MSLPYDDADPMQLYRYYPTFIKHQDELAGTDMAGETILQRITYMLEKEAGAHVEMLRRLILNLDVDNCEVSRLDYLAFILGVPVPGDWTDEVRRQYLRQIPGLLKIKGTHLNVQKQASFHGHRIQLVELWKTIEHEDRNYSQTQGYPYVIKSARLDMTSCLGSCESICESTCESTEEPGDLVPPGTAEAILQELGEVLPVHVLLRREHEYIEPNELFMEPGDSLGCHDFCQSICESVCEDSAEDWPGSYTESTFGEHLNLPGDNWAYQTICVEACESYCTTCCECGQEGTCQTLCEVTCQVVCETVCQAACMAACQGACQFACQSSCESVCEGTGE